MSVSRYLLAGPFYQNFQQRDLIQEARPSHEDQEAEMRPKPSNSLNSPVSVPCVFSFLSDTSTCKLERWEQQSQEDMDIIYVWLQRN
ncbi:unnamed protein product [Dovyalis caffra]|uniref:Uncharacterized protein n=1 Tax=Dovyalis caffra TaxID=77055 RepID=A0AAV1REE7_9ROSI|nr:unnamed protein product [Dovyalis caffra]